MGGFQDGLDLRAAVTNFQEFHIKALFLLKKNHRTHKSLVMLGHERILNPKLGLWSINF